jgi:ferredoxin
MTFIVTEACINCRYTDCVDVCPTDCFHEGPNFLVIDPEACIDCAACVDECPVNAIYDVADVPSEQQHYIALNAERAKQWPLINKKSAPLPEAEKWSKVKEKFAQLEST